MTPSENNKQVDEYPLRQLYFYLTEGCNLACRHCYIDPKFQTGQHEYQTLPVSIFRSVIEQAKPLGLTGVKLSGGEPLLHPQILELVSHIRQNELGLTLETNGTLCTPELAGEIARCCNPSVSVSLDGADAATHDWMRGVQGAFDDALEGIANLIGAGLHPQMIMTVTRRNKDQMEAVVRLAESLGAGSVKFNLLQPVSRGKQLYEAGYDLPIEELIPLGEWVEKTLSTSTPLYVFFDQPMAFRPLGNMFGKEGSCSRCNINAILGVLADGSYTLCGIGNIDSGCIFGNAAKGELATVWKNSPLLRELRKGLTGRLEGICKDCLMKDICLGSCIAQSFYRHKSLWKPHWFCEQANEKGLFPSARSR
jgi:SynChlorMet cassette radical SAM/SPASM protein ScmF